MKKIGWWCVAVVSWATAALHAQTLEATREIPLRSYTNYSILGYLNGQLMLMRANNDVCHIHAFDENMNEKWDKKVELDEKQARVIESQNTGDQHFWLFYQYKQHGREYLKAARYDHKLKRTDTVTVRRYDRRAFAPHPEVFWSQDKSKALFFEVEQDRTVAAFVFDTRTMQPLWVRSFDPPDNFNYTLDFLQVMVDNDGAMYLLYQKDNRRAKKEDNRLVFFNYHPTTDQVHHFFIPMAGLFTFDVKMGFDHLHQRIVVAGLASEKRPSVANGYFFLQIPPHQYEAHVFSYHPLQPELLARLLGKEVDEKESFGEISVNEFVLRSDGGILLVAERNKKYIRRSGSLYPYTPYAAQQTTTQVDYYFDEILVLSIHPSGDLHWGEVLHKKQFSQDDNGNFSSYFLVKTRQYLKFLYNDQVKSTTSLAEYNLTGDGKSERDHVLSLDTHLYKLRVKDALQVAANEVIIPSERRQQLRLVRLTYP